MTHPNDAHVNAAAEEVAAFALFSPVLRFTYTERFWMRVCLSLAEQARVSAERLDARVQDEHLMAFYAWDTHPQNPETRDEVRNRLAQSSLRYRAIEIELFHWMDEAKRWGERETARLLADERALDGKAEP